MIEPDVYRLGLNSRWTLEDLNDFARLYGQAYAYSFHALQNQEEGTRPTERGLDHIFWTYPWQGGYSAVNFYNQLHREIPRPYRPRIEAISYHSPGYIDLLVLVPASNLLKRVVVNLTDSFDAIRKQYSLIYEDLHKRKLMKIEAREAELRLKQAELEYIKSAKAEFANMLGVPTSTMPYQPESSLGELKALLSFYRRARGLSEYQSKGKVDL